MPIRITYKVLFIFVYNYILKIHMPVQLEISIQGLDIELRHLQIQRSFIDDYKCLVCVFGSSQLVVLSLLILSQPPFKSLGTSRWAFLAIYLCHMLIFP